MKTSVATLNSIDHITGSLSLPVHITPIADFINKKRTIRTVVLSADFAEMLNFLSTSADPSPKDPFDAVLAHFKTSTGIYHKYLNLEAENLRLEPGTSLDDYVKRHNSSRARIVASQFFNSGDGTTTVELPVESLRHKSKTTDIGRQPLTISFQSSEILHTTSIALYLYNTTSSPSKSATYPTSVLHQPVPPSPAYQKRPRIRQAHFLCTVTPSQQAANFRPCSLH